MQHEFEFNDEKIVINIEGEEYQQYKELAVRIVVEREKEIQVRIKRNCHFDETHFCFNEIDAIDGILVHVIMQIDQITCHEISNGYRVFLSIRENINENQRLMSQFLQTKIEKVTIDVIIGCLIQMKHILSNIKFCNMECKFQHVKKIENAMKKRKNIKAIFQSDNIKIKGDICSICHELTTRKLICSHHLCVRCYQSMREKMLNELEDDDGSRDLQCPLCRKEFCMYDYF